MNNSFYIIFLSIFLFSCGGTDLKVDNHIDCELQVEEVQKGINSIRPLFRKCDVTEIGNSCGYYTINGEEIIAKGKYEICLTDTFAAMARVFHPKKGFVGINQKEEVLFKIYDNGVHADQPFEGIFRITDGGNIGLADLNGNIIVPTKYSGLFGFENGFAVFCDGCYREYEGEHVDWLGGKWGALDKTGKEVIPAIYDQPFSFTREGTAQVQLNGEEITIDMQGNKI